MKVYVDELPKNCKDCKFQCFGECLNGADIINCDYSSMKCHLKRGKVKECPLQSLSDHTKQVRKEVVEFIDKCFEMQKYESIWINPDKTEFSCDVSYAYEWWESFRKILLDQIQGETK